MVLALRGGSTPNKITWVQQRQHHSARESARERMLSLALRQRETHPVCLACSAESATEAISLALSSTERVFHIALKLLDIQYIREGDLQRRQ